MTTGPAPLCLSGIHLTGDPVRFWTCSAFPGDIPVEMTSFEVDHRLPYDGDHGIQFEPQPELGESERVALYRMLNSLFAEMEDE